VTVACKAALALLLLLPACAHDPWTRADSYRQAAVAVVQIVDWRQTRHIAKDLEPQRVVYPDGSEVIRAQPRYRYDEANPILGEHPSTSKVDAYFAASIAGNALVSYLLPRDWREGWQYFSLGFEGGVVVYNFKAGISW
jgi:hypothetical protein